MAADICSAEALSWVKCYIYAKQSMDILPLVFLVSFHVFYVVFLYLNARIMPIAGYKTHEMGPVR